MQDSTGTRGKLRDIYDILLNSFGHQGWWPVYSDGGPGYHPGDFSYPRTEKQRVEIAFGAILTQQASWKNVEKVLFALIREELMDMEKLLKIPEERLQSLIRPSGYFRQKAERLRTFSNFVLKNYGDLESFFSLDIYELRSELLSIKGIGKETADSIVLYAAKKPAFVVDAYTYRAMERMERMEKRDYDAVQEMFHRSIERNPEIYNEYHALFVELGKRFCRKKPLCSGCPLEMLCPYNKKT